MTNLAGIKIKYKLIMEYSRDIVLFFQKDGRIIDCNKTAKDILGYGNDIYGISISDVFRDAIKLQNSQLKINPKYKKAVYEATAYKRDKTCISVEMKIVSADVGSNRIGMCIATDITLQKKLTSMIKRLRSDMRKLLGLKNNIIRNITHELKTPVNGILGMSETLMEMELNAKQRDNVSLIYECCKNINSLINDLLDVIRLKYNKLVLDENAFNLYMMIVSIMKLNIKHIKEKGLTPIVNISGDIPKILVGDEYRLTQIINNLLSNAIKFTDRGKIVLDVSMTEYIDDEVELLFMVMDTGIGISDKEKNKLFMSFYQVDKSTTRGYGGVGLGLSICQLLIRAMGGRITVESEMNKGSTFSFTVRLKTKDKRISGNTEDKDTDMDDVYKSFQEDHVDRLLGDLAIPSDIRMVDYSSDIIAYDNTVSSSEQYLQLIIERLKATIDMKNWKHAEQLTQLVRCMITHEDKLVTNKALQLLFSIRKEDHELSIEQAKELDRLLRNIR